MVADMEMCRAKSGTPYSLNYKTLHQQALFFIVEEKKMVQRHTK